MLACRVGERFPVSVAALLLLTLVPVLIAYAAASDLLTMTIPNRLCLSVVALFLPVAWWAGMDATVIGMNVLAGLLVLSVTFGFFAAGWIGGGDAKFVAACAFWMGFDQLLPYLVVASVLGGGLTLAILWMKAHPIPALAVHLPWYARLQDRDTGIPYGIALSFAGLLLLPYTQVWSAAFAI